MSAKRVPRDVAAAIRKCWPDGVIEEFDAEESYFQDIRAALESDLRRISGATLRWQTEREDTDFHLDDDEDEPSFRREFESYHVFFLSPKGKEFEFEDETETVEEGEDLEELITTTVPGKTWFGCTLAVSLAAPVAAVLPGDYSEFEDATISAADLLYVPMSDDETGEPIDMDEQYRQAMGQAASAKLVGLRQKIAAVLAKYNVLLLDESVLNLPAPRMRAGEEIFVDGEPSVRDTFFFRGV